MKATEEFPPDDDLTDDFGRPAAEDVSEHDVDLVQLAWSSKWLLAGGLLAGVLLGQLAYWKLGPEYEAQTQVLVSKKAAALNEEGEAATYGDRAEHIALIMSPMIVGEAIERHDLRELPSLANSEDPVEDILDALKVKRSAGHDRSFLNVLDLSYRNRRPQDAEAVMAAIVDAYRIYLSDSYEQNTREVLQLVQEASRDLHERLRKKEQEYLDFRDSVPLHWNAPPGAELGPASAVNVHEDNLRAIESERRANLLRQAELKSKIRTLRDAQEDGQPAAALALLVQQMMAAAGSQSVAGSAAGLSGTAAVESQLLPLLIEEKRLLRDFGEDHPDVQSVRRSIETIREFYRQRGVAVPGFKTAASGPAEKSRTSPGTSTTDSVTVYLQALEQQLIGLEHRNAELQRLHAEELRLSKEFARYQAEDQKRHDELQRIKTLWNAVAGRLNRQSLEGRDSGYTLRQIAPIRSEFVLKRQIKFLGAGGVLGLAIVAAGVYLRAWRSTTFQSLEELRRSVVLPVMGSIPEFPAAGHPDRAAGATSTLLPELCYYHNPGSPEAEAYRALRTTLSIGPAGSRLRILQITSPEPGDGKTTLVANLAMALAHSGRRVLLVDADLRKPRIHELFGIPQDVGLADVLVGDVEWINAVRETVVDGLALMTAGLPAPAPAEMLASPRLDRFFQEARAEFDFVLVDSPPLLAVSDAAITSGQADAVLLVVRLSKTRKAAVRQAAELLEVHQVRVLGAVANGIVAAGDVYGYGANSYRFPPGQRPRSEASRSPERPELPLEV